MESEPITMAESLARGIRRLRTARGLSQGDLADAAGVSRNLVSNLERGKSSAGAESDPQLSTLIRLAGALAASPCELLFPPDDPHQLVMLGADELEAREAWGRFAGISGYSASMEPLVESYVEHMQTQWAIQESGYENSVDMLQASVAELQGIVEKIREKTSDG